jgi:hypothetical protein
LVSIYDRIAKRWITKRCGACLARDGAQVGALLHPLPRAADSTRAPRLPTMAPSSNLSSPKGDAMFFDYNGIIGLIILVLDIWAIINIVKSSAPDTNKILWVVIVILLPVIGLILWFLLGPGKKRGTSV